jgi:two-component system, chemotaxis family, CheB/CheR fusion protein
MAGLPVVAIGASAGGLNAFRTLLAALPADSGMIFILVQHLDPTHPSMMLNLLSPHTGMAGHEAAEGMRLEPDHFYLIPPGRYLVVRNGVFHLSHPGRGQGVRLPFDFLLQSLADGFRERSVCVIVSGTGSDGTLGAKAVKEAGGAVIAQEPKEAEYDGMPRAAIASGNVDLVLPLAEIPAALVRYGASRHLGTEEGAPAPATGAGLEPIIELLRKGTSHDFALYKEGTLGRRIQRRMALAGLQDSGQYLDLLKRDGVELQHLADDLFINVTRFFRTEKAFDLLAEKIVPGIVHARAADQAVRVWVPGCSTGEEAYSLAMLFQEAIAAEKRDIKLQIFASDIDGDAIAVAREGLYPLSIEADVSPARLARFFTREERGYRVSRDLRATIVFSVHDLLTDAPFSSLDLISCRNLLIYLRPAVQQKVLALFHYALREDGILFLGAAETVGPAKDHFELVSKSLRIYRHIGRSRPGEVELPIGRGEPTRPLWRAHAPPPRRSVGELAQQLLLETFAPASVLASQARQALYYFGPVDRYLMTPAGVASLDVLASAREGLRPAIRAAWDKASGPGGEAVSATGRVKRNGSTASVTVSARPVKGDGTDLILLSFLDEPTGETKAPALAESPVDGSRVAQLERELDGARKDLEEAVHDREAAEEELRAINEEAMSTTEEFQTTNEELETSREELQSLNEELTALNSQLQETLDQHRVVANDLENILTSSDVAVLFLDGELKIRFFTPALKPLFSVIASDVGRPLADLAHHFADRDLLTDARSVLSDLIPLTREIQAENGAWYTRRVLPYRTKDNRIEGVVITFADVTVRRKAEEAMDSARLTAEGANLAKSRFLAAASHDLRQPLQTLNLLQGILARKIKDKEALQLVASSEETLAAMSGMLNTLLDINQIEAGVVHPEVVAFRINDVFERLKTEFAYHAQSHKLAWRVRPCRFTVRTDPRLLEQMIRNLVSNAVKYTRQGGILLGCRRRGDKLRIEVWDTGLGIPREQLHAIFEEFHQLDNPTRELTRGLGLGLAIVQRLADLLGHGIDVHSREGRGSVFAIEVPLVVNGAPHAPEGPVPEPKKVTARSGLILIVEDDPAVRDSLDFLLRTDGQRTATAASGEEAIQLAVRDALRPDVVVVDYNLPGGLTGLQVLTRLRDVLGHSVPAIVLTGDISTETLRDIARSGYLSRSKPVPAQELTGLIRSLLAASPAPT